MVRLLRRRARLRSLFLMSLTAATLLVGLASPAAAQCEADGAVQFVCGPVNPEDLILVPQSPWVIVSSMEDDGYLSATDSRDYSSTVVFPAATSRSRHDTATYGSCPGVATDQFRPHGISLRPGPDGVHRLYVVRHGVRESVEVFEVDASGETPTLTWVGCAVAPDALSLNAVVPLPDGGFAATSPRTRESGNGIRRRGGPGCRAVRTSARTEDWRSRRTASGSMLPGTKASR